MRYCTLILGIMLAVVGSQTPALAAGGHGHHGGNSGGVVHNNNVSHAPEVDRFYSPASASRRFYLGSPWRDGHHSWDNGHHYGNHGYYSPGATLGYNSGN